MPKTGAEERVAYGFVKLPEDLIAEVDAIIGKHGYRSRAEFVKEATRILLNTYQSVKIRPSLEHFNLNEAGVQVLDRDLQRVIQIYFKPDKVICEYDQSNSCKHVDFALDLPEVQEILKKKGWKPE